MTKPEKQDGTMELDVGQIDLLDLPLPPRSKPAVDAEEPRGSKGPPPLPPSAPPPAEEEPQVPSLAIPNSSPSQSQPHPPPGAISARQLAFGPPPKPKSPAVQLMLGMGGATILCVLAFFGWKMTHKTHVAPAPAASSAVAPAPTHAFTMAPIEFTTPASSGSAPPEETAAPSAHATPTATTTSTTKPSSAHGVPTSSGKPPKTDELIKVEN